MRNLDKACAHDPVVELTFIERLIQRIEPPKYEQILENENALDRIRVTVNLSQHMLNSRAELRTAISENEAEIMRRVIQQIETDRQFKKYGVSFYITTHKIKCRRLIIN